jgi:hypothetical protein
MKQKFGSRWFADFNINRVVDEFCLVVHKDYLKLGKNRLFDRYMQILIMYFFNFWLMVKSFLAKRPCFYFISKFNIS